MIHFPTDKILEPRMLLMKEMKYLFFNWNLDDGTCNVHKHAPTMTDGDAEHGFCKDQITLEHNFHV